MGPLNVKCQLIWAGHGHLSAMGTNYRKSRGQTAQFLAYTTFLMIAEASIKTEIKVVILSRKLFSSVKCNALLFQFFILTRSEQNSLTSPIDMMVLAGGWCSYLYRYLMMILMLLWCEYWSCHSWLCKGCQLN